jgi:hypothetical protein
MKNNFDEETRELFFWNRHCWLCNMQHANCLHHILGRVSNSPLNAAPLNNFDCHIGKGIISTFDMKCNFLQKTLSYLLEKGYVLTKKDKEFKKKYSKYYK